jgi:4,5:9,10-diseco-3-hydroxy-5,9,17-trioxoandrosta-1(10),2-diene-4-oate hydrolase
VIDVVRLYYMVTSREVTLALDITQGTQIINLSDTYKVDLLVQGNGLPVLWLHSGFRGRIGLGNLISVVERKLKQNNFEWLNLIPNLPGFGKSTSGPSQNTNPYELAEIIEDFVNHLDIPRLDIIGYSLGANIASILVNRIPERFTRVVLLGTAIEGKNLDVYRSLLELHDEGNWDGIVTAISHNLVGSKNRQQYLKMMPLIRKQVSSKRFSEDLSRILSSGIRLDVFEEIKNIRQPTLMISGSDDPFLPTPERIRALEQKKNIAFVLLNGIGHNELVFPRQVDISDQIIHFLER